MGSPLLDLTMALPEQVGLSSAGLDAAFAAFEQKYRDGLIPGGVMSVGRTGKLCFCKAFGVRDVENQESLRADTIFNVASMTKSVTCVAAMILCERGIIGLDVPVSKYIPEFAIDKLSVVSYASGTVPCQNDITVRMAMNHTAGYSYGAFLRRPNGDPIAQTDKALSSASKTSDFLGVPLAFQPGTRFRYSPSTTILGWVVEQASGVSLDHFFSKEIFEPLGMLDTAFEVPECKRHRLATAYVQANDKSPMAFLAACSEEDSGAPGDLQALTPFSRARNPVLGDAGLFSTAKDWHLFSTMLAGKGLCAGPGGPKDGARLIKEKTWQVLTAASTPDMDAVNAPTRGDREKLFCTHFSDRADGSNSGPGSGGPQLFGNLWRGGIAHNLIGYVVTSGGAGNSLGASHGTFGWEGIFGTKYIVDPCEGLTVCFMSSVAPCWRFNFMLELLPLVYVAIEDPLTEHATNHLETSRL